MIVDVCAVPNSVQTCMLIPQRADLKYLNNYKFEKSSLLKITNPRAYNSQNASFAVRLIYFIKFDRRKILCRAIEVIIL